MTVSKACSAIMAMPIAESWPAMASPAFSLELKQSPEDWMDTLDAGPQLHPPGVFLGSARCASLTRSVINPRFLSLDGENEDGLAFKPEGVL